MPPKDTVVIRVDQQAYSALMERGVPGETPNDALRHALGLPTREKPQRAQRKLGQTFEFKT